MKRIIYSLIIILGVAGLSSCQSQERRALEVADSFLTAYYSADYIVAANSCTPSMATQVKKGDQAMGLLPKDMAEKVKEAVAKTSFKIVGAEVAEDGKTAVVRYDLEVPQSDYPVSKLLEIKFEGRTAKVDGIR